MPLDKVPVFMINKMLSKPESSNIDDIFFILNINENKSVNNNCNNNHKHSYGNYPARGPVSFQGNDSNCYHENYQNERANDDDGDDGPREQTATPLVAVISTIVVTIASKRGIDTTTIAAAELILSVTLV